MIQRRFVVLAATGVLFCSAGSSRAQILSGQVDTFQDGTMMGWGGGAALENVANGGPLGAGDRFLQVTSFGGSGGGSRLATFNGSQWTGDYLAAGVTHISVQMLNRGNTELSMRLVLFDFSDGETQWTSTEAQLLPAASGWTLLTFPIAESALTMVEGTVNYTDTLSGVDRLMFRHQVGTPGTGGTPIATSAGIDNITAVPEPGVAAAIAFGLGGLGLRLLKRRK